MKKLISALCAGLSILAWVIYFVRVSRISTITDFTGLLLFVPTLLALPGSIFAFMANKEQKSPFTMALIIINVIFFFSLAIIHIFGTLLGGV